MLIWQMFRAASILMFHRVKDVGGSLFKVHI